jgi:signal transduction histidine kinase
MTNPAWCALLCDKDGRIIRFFQEQRADASKMTPCSLIGLTEPGALVEFLEAVRTRGVICGWEMTIHYKGTARNILLHGFLTPQGTLVLPVWLVRPPAPQTGQSADPFPVTHPRTRDHARQNRSLFEVAHDLQNPICSIISACEYLATYSRENLNPDQMEMIAGIGSAAETLLQLSHRLSERTKVRSGGAG